MIELKVCFESLCKIDLSNYQYSVLTKLNLTWSDNRLVFQNIDNKTTTPLTLKGFKIWQPNIYFRNADYKDFINVNGEVNTVTHMNIKSVSEPEFVVLNSYEGKTYLFFSVNLLLPRRRQ